MVVPGATWDSMGGGTWGCPGLAWRQRSQVGFCKTGGAGGGGQGLGWGLWEVHPAHLLEKSPGSAAGTAG